MNFALFMITITLLSPSSWAGESDVDPTMIVHSCTSAWCAPVVAAYQQCLEDGRTDCEHDRKVKSAHYRTLGMEPPEHLSDDYEERTASAMKDRENAYQKYAQELRERQDSEASGKLRQLSFAKYCSAYGDAVRNQYLDDIGLSPKIVRMTKLEAKRRGLRMDDKLIAAGKIRVGLTECSMIASWGIPQSSNRTVTAALIRTQHVYGNLGPYVYTVNGVITGWQD